MNKPRLIDAEEEKNRTTEKHVSEKSTKSTDNNRHRISTALHRDLFGKIDDVNTSSDESDEDLEFDEDSSHLSDDEMNEEEKIL